METVSLLTTTVGILTQVALFMKGAKSLLNEYGDDVIGIGKTIFGFVKDQLDSNKETEGEVDYFSVNPEQEKRQKAIAESLATLIEQNQSFRTRLEEHILEFKNNVPVESISKTEASVKVKVSIRGDIKDSKILTAGHDITITDK